MKTDQRSTLQQSIEAIGTGVFFNLSDSVLKLPTSLVSTLRADDFGYVWFTTPKAYEERQELEVTFPSRLHLFRKGANISIEIVGMGHIVSDPEELFLVKEIADELLSSARPGSVLVKMRICEAIVRSPQTLRDVPVWRNALNLLTSWLGSAYQFRPKGTYSPTS